MICFGVIKLAHHVETYCMKTLGHDGPHELPEDMKDLYLNQSKRCVAVHPTNGVMCGLPSGHVGNHQNGLLTPPWEEKQKSS